MPRLSPPNRWLLSATLALLSGGCTGVGLDVTAPDVLSGGDDTGLGQVSETEPPRLVELEPFRNSDALTVTGRALPGEVVTLLVSGFSQTDEYLATADDAGDFAHEIIIERGVDVEIVATNSNGASDPAVTHACAMWDSYEIDEFNGDDYGDTCLDNPVAASDDFTDALSLTTLVGNALTEGDEDWYRFVTVDETLIEDQFGFENYHFEVSFLEGEDRYAFEVYRGGCASSQRECPGSEYTAYDYFAEDVEPDDLGDLPPDPRACGGNPYNHCPDFSATYFIAVRRTDGQLNCDGYQIQVQNGSN